MCILNTCQKILKKILKLQSGYKIYLCVDHVHIEYMPKNNQVTVVKGTKR